MTTKEFRIVMTFSVTAFLFLFTLIIFDINIDLSPDEAQAATYTLSPTYYYTDTVPGLLSYQGTLADGNGDPIDGNVEMTFRIYTTIGGTPLYTETHPAVVVRAGDFAVLLGDIVPFPDGLFAEPNRYLGLQVGAQAEMSPRQRFASVAFAMESSNADTVDGQHVVDITPIGSIIAWHKSFTDTPTLPDGWVECNGQVLNDADSPYDSQTIPDLNSDVGGVGDGGRFLRGNITSGIIQDHQFETHKHDVSVRVPVWSGGDRFTGHDKQLNYVVYRTTDPVTGNHGNETRPVNMSVVWIMRVK